MIPILTLCIVQQTLESDRARRVLLGMKKRGPGMGWWNGFGGKMHAGETVEAAARRELLEEAGIRALDLEERAWLHFEFVDENGVSIFEEGLVFLVQKFQGEPRESEEMLPQWFDESEIPYEKMWPGDRHWLPLILEGKKVAATFVFGPGNVLLKHEVTVL